MTRSFVGCILACLLVFSCSQVKKVQVPEVLPSALPELRILNDTSAAAPRISTLSIDIQVAANIAVTTFNMKFYNPNDRVLEGEFEFPLADGQNIVGYALDIEGYMREGVIVEKAKARVAFENTIRPKVDPGLVEKTKGNNFRTRIYPLPAKGSRSISITVEQPLAQVDRDLLYQLPLYAAQPIDKFSVSANVIKSPEKPIVHENGLPGFTFGSKKEGWDADWKKDNFLPNHDLAFRIPFVPGKEITTLVENHRGETFFYVHNRMEPKFQNKKLPGTIGLLWDISASGERRNIEKEKQLLKEYFSNAGNTKLVLIPFNIDVPGKEELEIKNGNCEALLSKLNQFQYDGGTQFGVIDLNTYKVDEFLLFSDGLSNFGKKEVRFSSAPVTVISSSSSADIAHLKFIAKQSRGKFIDISALEIRPAIDALQTMPLEVVGVDIDTTAISDLVIPVSSIQSHGICLAGKLKKPSAEIKLKLGYGKETVTTQAFTITKPEESDYRHVKRIWAGLKIAELELEFEKNKERITWLGKEYSLVTQNTSLIVLERVEDYVEHDIVPPEDLREQYFTLRGNRMEMEKAEKETAIAEALNYMDELKEWWNKDHESTVKTIHFTPIVVKADTATTITGNDNLFGNSVSTDSAQGTIVANGIVADDAVSTPPPAMAELSEAKELMALNFTTTKDEAETALPVTAKPEEAVANIELKPWQPETPYLKTLQSADVSKREAAYFSLKKQYGAQPSFFIDAARFFISKNERKIGLRILSNVAEMKLEDAELLRMIANQLMESNEKELAIETFREIVKMREEDPQSYRDLALALSEAGQYNEAVKLLYKVIIDPWDGRFGEIKAIAINEMNAIISARKSELDLTGIDKRFIYAMPVDVRIVVGWSTDNSDVDLWVTDPRKEKCSYEHQDTEIGGKISRDVTQGFGPEEFCLKKAWNGKYVVEVNLYGDTRQTMGGPISIKADLYTNFGKPNQKKETIHFRVTSSKEVVEVGSLTFKS